MILKNMKKRINKFPLILLLGFTFLNNNVYSNEEMNNKENNQNEIKIVKKETIDKIMEMKEINKNNLLEERFNYDNKIENLLFSLNNEVMNGFYSQVKDFDKKMSSLNEIRAIHKSMINLIDTAQKNYQNDLANKKISEEFKKYINDITKEQNILKETILFNENLLNIEKYSNKNINFEKIKNYNLQQVKNIENILETLNKTNEEENKKYIKILTNKYINIIHNELHIIHFIEKTQKNFKTYIEFSKMARDGFMNDENVLVKIVDYNDQNLLYKFLSSNEVKDSVSPDFVKALDNFLVLKNQLNDLQKDMDVIFTNKNNGNKIEIYNTIKQKINEVKAKAFENKNEFESIIKKYSSNPIVKKYVNADKILQDNFNEIQLNEAILFKMVEDYQQNNK